MQTFPFGPSAEKTCSESSGQVEVMSGSCGSCVGAKLQRMAINHSGSLSQHSPPQPFLLSPLSMVPSSELKLQVQACTVGGDKSRAGKGERQEQTWD